MVKCQKRDCLIVIKILFYVAKNMFFCVKYGSSLSEVWKISSGVRRGGIWSTSLFIFYVKDLIDHISQTGISFRLGGYSCNILYYGMLC